MENMNSVSARALNQAMEKARNHQLGEPAQLSKVTQPGPASELAPVSNKAVFDRVGQRGAKASELPDHAPLEQGLDQTPGLKLQANASLVPRPNGLQRTQSQGQILPFSHQGDKALVETLMKGLNESGQPRFSDIKRGADAIAASGILDDFKLLADRKIEVPASEFSRSIADDAVLVMQGFAKMSPEQIAARKEQAYKHPEFAAEHQGAIDKGYYGSAKHREFGALVESLTGGLVSAEEAMSMCPCGGIPGDGAKEIPLASKIDPIARHAMRHDALGFLLTRFEVGPGYGSKTTILGRESNDPLAGQILGVAREVFKTGSVMPESEHIAKPGRFNA